MCNGLNEKRLEPVDSWEIGHKRVKTTQVGSDVNTQGRWQNLLGRGDQLGPVNILAWKIPNPKSKDILIQLRGLVVPAESPAGHSSDQLMPHKQQVQGVTSYPLLNRHVKAPRQLSKKEAPAKTAKEEKLRTWQDTKSCGGGSTWQDRTSVGVKFQPSFCITLAFPTLFPPCVLQHALPCSSAWWHRVGVDGWIDPLLGLRGLLGLL